MAGQGVCVLSNAYIYIRAHIPAYNRAKKGLSCLCCPAYRRVSCSSSSSALQGQYIKCHTGRSMHHGVKA